MNHPTKNLLATACLLAQPALAADPVLTDCRQIEDIAERVACYDRHVDSQSSADAQHNAEQSSEPDAKETRAAPDAESLFGKNDADAKRIVEASMAIDELAQIEAQVADVRESGRRKLTVMLDNGQVWRQLDSRPMLLKSGDTVVIREASLGSYLLEKKSGGRSIRVKRAN